jgi:hypothetical protein
MAAIVDQDELDNVASQLSGSPVAAPVQNAPVQSGPILDPDELAHVQQQLSERIAPEEKKAAVAAAVAPILAQQAAPEAGGFTGAIESATKALDPGWITNHLPFSDRVGALGDVAGSYIAGKPASYADALAHERARQASEAAASPTLDKVGTGLSMAMIPPGVGQAVTQAPTAMGNVLRGMAGGAGIGAVQGASGTPDLSNPVDAAQHIGIGAATGGAMGGAVPLAAGAVGSGYNAVANAFSGGAQGISRRAANPILEAIQADTPQAVQGAMQRLGPEGMLADAGPALLGKTQGVVLNSDEARNAAYTALQARDAGTNTRLAQSINEAIGPAQSPLQATQALQAQRTAIHSALPDIFAQSPPVDTSGVLGTIGQGLNTAVGPEAAVLGRARAYLVRQGEEGPVPITDAETLQNAKMAIDTLIDRGDPRLGVQPGAVSKSQGSIGTVRRQLNQALRDQVPGYSGVMDQSSHLASQMEAIEQGNSLLRGGANATRPDDLAAQLQQQMATDPARAQMQMAGLRTGARAAIDQTVGTKANDLVALRNAMQGEGGWNEANLAHVFGAQPVGDITNSVANNTTFRNTLQNVVQNSQTAQRQAAAAAMKPEAQTGGIPLINPNMTVTGALATPVKALGRALLSQVRTDPTRSYGEIARVLTAQGPQAQQHTSALIDALQRRTANSATANRLGDNSALISALIGGQALNNRLQRQ